MYEKEITTFVVIETPSIKNPRQIANLMSMSVFLFFILNIKINELKTHSAKDSKEPNPIVIIIKKKNIHQTNGKGIKLKASGYTFISSSTYNSTH